MEMEPRNDEQAALWNGTAGQAWVDHILSHPAMVEWERQALIKLRPVAGDPALEVDAVMPERYLLITRTGDEVLDYREAVVKYRGGEQLVIEGGDHGFGDFAPYLDRALTFCGVGGVVARDCP